MTLSSQAIISHQDPPSRRSCKAALGAILLAAGLAMAGATTAPAGQIENAALAAGLICSATAKLAKKACRNEVRDDFWITVGNCINISDAGAREDCLDEAAETQREDGRFCREQFIARGDLCADIGEAAYEPEVTPLSSGAGPVPTFEPGNFPLSPAQTVDTANPFFPLVPGRTWVYQASEDGEVVEQVTVSIEDEVKVIGGVPCLTVRDVVREGDDPDAPVVEDTDDWYAQDFDGNVWYCGEIAQNFEIFEEDPDPQVELVDIEGSWKGFVDFAKPGIIMLADPRVGDVYRQELALGSAEDAAEVLSLTGSAETPAASCDGDCLVTADFTPIEPDALEHKYYAEDVGLILETKPGTDERLELVEFTP